MLLDLEGEDPAGQARRTAERLIALVGLPVPLGEGAAVTVGGSAGVALWPADHADPREVLELARDRIGVLERAAQTHKQDEASLRSENARLLGRLMDQMSMQAQAMDSEIRAHEERIAASAEASGTVPGADGSETSAAEAARGAGDSGAARRDAAPRDRF